MASSTPGTSVAFFTCLWIFVLAKDQQQITVKLGDDVTLQCLDHRGGDIELLEWTRQDPNENVFVWKHGKMFEDPQHPSFQNRVELRDPEMKDGDVSVILKNVTIKDTGTYKCRLRNNKTKSPPHLISTIILTVTVSGGEGGHTGEGGDDGGRFRLVVALLVCNVLLFIGMICMIYRKCYGHVKKNPSKQLFNTQPEMSIYC